MQSIYITKPIILFIYEKCNIIMALAATTVFAACNNDNELVQQKVSGEEVNFFIDNAPITRTSVNTSDASTKFVENDQIGIYATGGATASNVGYQVGSGSDGALSPISGTINWSSEAAGTSMHIILMHQLNQQQERLLLP